ncbi:MAG TPA: hypothetical protein VH144_01085 [Candidatus Saccharimonadales bacterium]|jgi:hypothetical protein|nr:hypothetical protein [Candidatus Saccharimonadales bacterium]
MKPQTKRSGVGRAVVLIFNLALIVLAVWIFFNRQYVFDQIMLIGYQPTAEVASLASDTTMTSESVRDFYASRPTVDNRTDFNAHCKNTGEQTIVLGCYAARQIHVYDVNDPRLPGVKQVTAAHEMLHAAYDRLSSDEKDTIKGMIDRQLKSLNDDHIKQLIDIYNKTEPGELYNEMHSILGTEVRSLNPELENYYTRYFTNREKVVDYSQGYESVFANLKDQQTALVSELDSLASSINQQTTQLNAKVEALNADVNSFNQRAQGSGFASQAEFNSQRNALMTRQSALQTERLSIENQIASYNQKKAQLEAINLEAQSLNNSINSSPASVPTVQ